jgi:hypothetical protein
MKLIKSNFKPIFERWDDPGDYPSGAGAGPLPSHTYCVDIEGEAIIEIEELDWWREFGDVIDEAREMASGEMASSETHVVVSFSMRIESEASKLLCHMTVAEFDETTIALDDEENNYREDWDT